MFPEEKRKGWKRREKELEEGEKVPVEKKKA